MVKIIVNPNPTMPYPVQIVGEPKYGKPTSNQPTTRQLYNQQKYENLIRGSDFRNYNPQRDVQEHEFFDPENMDH